KGFPFPFLHVFYLGKQADELTEHHRGRSPHLVTEQIEVRIFDRDSLANSRCITYMFERHFEDLLDLPWRSRKVRPPIGDAHDRVQRESADDDVNRRELA